MSDWYAVFEDVEFAGGLTGPGSIVVERGLVDVRLSRPVRNVGCMLALAVGTVGIAGAAMYFYRYHFNPRHRFSPWFYIIPGVVMMVVFVLITVVKLRRPLLSYWMYDALPPVTDRDKVAFVRRKAVPDRFGHFDWLMPEQLTVTFESQTDAERCYKVFTGKDVPESAEG